MTWALGTWARGTWATGTWFGDALPAAEVYWPGTKIPRSKHKEMQRAALARYLIAERERLEDERKEQERIPKVEKKKIAGRVFRKIVSAGILPVSQADAAKQAFIDAQVTFANFIGLVEQIVYDTTFTEAKAQAAIKAWMDEEDEILLLLSA
jgi:hypothetical protein